MKRVLVINPGATSTKVGIFDDEKIKLQKNLEHSTSELQEFSKVMDQYELRLNYILDLLLEEGISQESLNAVVARGGKLKPLSGGTYIINDIMIKDLRLAKNGEHASNLGAIIAKSIADKNNIPAYIVDPVSVDEFSPEARISGLNELPRLSMSHALNCKAVARKVAQDMGKEYSEVNFVVTHLGGGISVTAHDHGQMIDVNDAQEEGPFSPDRTGGLPARALARLCYSGKYTESEMLKKISGSGGLYDLLGTKDIKEIQERINKGDNKAELVLKAMVYQIAKEIGAMATVLCGQVDRIIITGGIANSKQITQAVEEKVKFIAPVVVEPGEKELEALAKGALRVLDDKEKAEVYTE